MLAQVLDVLDQLGVLPVIQLVAVITGAIFVYRYFTDKG